MKTQNFLWIFAIAITLILIFQSLTFFSLLTDTQSPSQISTTPSSKPETSTLAITGIIVFITENPKVVWLDLTKDRKVDYAIELQCHPSKDTCNQDYIIGEKVTFTNLNFIEVISVEGTTANYYITTEETSFE